MVATSRLKQLLFIAAALALVTLGLAANFATASPARADDTQPCVPMDAWTETINHPAETHSVHHDAVTHVVHHEAVPGPWWNWSPNKEQGPFDGPPAFPTDARGTWQGPHTEGGPSQDLTGTFQQGAGNSPWFHREAGQPAYDETVVDHEAYDETVVDKEAWTETIEHPAVTCPDPGPDTCPEGTDKAGTEIPQGETAESFCDNPVVDDGKKVVVCKYVGTPPGTPDHIIVVSVNTLKDFPDPAVFPWTFPDAQDSIAIRFAVGNEQPGDEELVNCPTFQEPEVCPEGTDHAGDTIPQGETEESFCNEPDAVCPEGTDNAGQTIPEGDTEESFCNDPVVDDGKKVVVCKYVGPPPGTPDHIIVVSVNAIPGFDPENAVFPFEFADAQKSVAIRFAVGNEQPGDEELVNCPVEEEPEVCPEGTDNAGETIPEGETEETFCNDEEPPAVCPEGTDHVGETIPDGETEETFCNDEEPPAVCPEGTVHAGETIPQGETEESFCNEEPNPGPETCPEGTDKAGQEIPEGDTAEEFCDDDDEDEVCPDGTDHAGETIPQGESEESFCDDDDVPGPNCDEDPTQPGCDEPPVIVPDDGTTPSNHPGNGPTVKGAQGTTTAGTPAAPAARVPTAVDAGLAGPQRELAGTGGAVALLGLSTALLGAAMVGLTLRPRRRRNLAG